jgi:hypothetical protein
MAQSTARIATPLASRYLQQLCKHFAHKMPVEFTPEHGRIELRSGICLLDAEADTLMLSVEAADDTALESLQEVVRRHLERFAWKDVPQFVWVKG